MKGIKQAVTSRETADGLAVTCQCGRPFEIAPDDDHACPCGWRHEYDGAALLSRPAGVYVSRGQIHAAAGSGA